MRRRLAPLVLAVAVALTPAADAGAAKRKPKKAPVTCAVAKQQVKTAQRQVKAAQGRAKARPTKARKRQLAQRKKALAQKRRQQRSRCRAPAKAPVAAPAPGVPAADAPASQAPIDYRANPGLSAPRYDAKDIERTSTELAMADGKRVHLEVVKPKGAKDLGVILEASPYHGTLYDRTGTRILPLPLGADKKAVGLTGFFPPRGYAVVMMDLRGTGRSEGCLDHLGPKDQADLEAVIEWAARQDWSNGRVGMTGHSYVGGTSNFGAATHAEGLKTVVPSASLASMYDHQFQGGVPYNAQFLGPYAGYSLLALDADLPPTPVGDPVNGTPTGDGFGVDPASTGCGFTNLAANAGPTQVLGVEEDYHRERDAKAGATSFAGPIFLVHGVNDEAARIASIDWFTKRRRAGDKVWIGQWDHGIGCCPNQRGLQWTAALHAWFDRHLLQRDVATGPAVEVFLNDQPTVEDAVDARSEIATFPAWPPRSTTLELGTGDGTLGAPTGDGALSYVGDPFGYQGMETGHVDFVSDPFGRDVQVVGEPRMDLVVSQLGQGTNVIVNLLDRAPGGKERRIGHFAANAALRNGKDQVAVVTPAERMALDPAPWAMGHVLRAGHRLVLRVASSDGEHLPFGFADRVSVAYGPKGTKLRLPVTEDPARYADTFDVGPKIADPDVTG